MYVNDDRCDIYVKRVAQMRLHLPQMEDPEPTQFGNQMVHDLGSGCFSIFHLGLFGLAYETLPGYKIM